MKALILGAILIVLLVVLFLRKRSVGFRGGSEAIGGRTGGAAYSGATAELDPGMP